MALPARRTNLVLNPTPASPQNGTEFSNLGGGLGTWSHRTNEAEPYIRFTKDGTTATAGFAYGPTSQVTAAAGTVISMRLWVRSSAATTFVLRNESTAIAGATHALTANVWKEIVLNGHATTIANFRIGGQIANMAANSTIDFKRAIVELTPTSEGYFSGSTTEQGWGHGWNGLPNQSTSYRDAVGLWVDVVQSGTTRAILTVLGLGPTPSVTKVTRSDGVENWPVPGWLARNTSDADTGTDWTVPLGRPVTYTLYKDGIAIASRTVTVSATTGDIMDPLNPGAAIKINTVNTDPGILTLGAESIKSAIYENVQSDREFPLGARYAIARTGVRSSVQKVPFVLNAHSNATSDALLRMVEQAPILLIRSLPSWGDIPSLVYTDGAVEETPFNRGRGGSFTQWRVEGNTIAPMTRGASQGQVTHDQVKANLAGRTHDSIKTTSGTKRHVEVKANPLGLGQ